MVTHGHPHKASIEVEFGPVLSSELLGSQRPLSILYVCPGLALQALISEEEPRVECHVRECVCQASLQFIIALPALRKWTEIWMSALWGELLMDFVLQPQLNPSSGGYEEIFGQIVDTTDKYTKY